MAIPTKGQPNVALPPNWERNTGHLLGEKQNQEALHQANESDMQSKDKHEKDDPGRAEAAADRRPVVLVVDDEVPILDMLKRLLEEEYVVLTAHTGNEALAIARQTKPDLILTDLMMPQMNGLALCTYLRATPSTAHIPILVMSAVYQPHIGTTFSGFIAKPFKVDDILKQIRNSIN